MARTVNVPEGQTVRCEAPLPIFPRVSGRVLDRQGRPAAGIVVTVHPFGTTLPRTPRGDLIWAMTSVMAPKVDWW